MTYIKNEKFYLAVENCSFTNFVACKSSRKWHSQISALSEFWGQPQMLLFSFYSR